MKIVLSVIVCVTIWCSMFAEDAKLPALSIVVKQETGPVGDEKIVEIGEIKKDIIEEILKDVSNDITWKWSRIKYHDKRYLLLGGMKRPAMIGRLYELDKVDEKWKLKDTGKHIVASP